jgi:hypothetical protein
MGTERVVDIRQVNSAWAHMYRGLRAYGVAITVIWTMCTFSVLSALAVAADRWWLHVVFVVGAVLELICAALTLRFLIRASTAGRFDT